MFRLIARHRSLVVLSFALGASPLPACGADDPAPVSDLATLSIEGTAWRAIPAGATERLAVSYLDGDGEPRAGRVRFALVGDPAGATLSRAEADVTGDGTAAIELTCGDAAGTFQLQARAADAAPVAWTITVVRSGALRLQGHYALTSRLDARPALPGAAGGEPGVLLALTDDPHDPATFLLDRLTPELGGLVGELVAALRPGLDAVVEDAIVALVPDVVDRLAALSVGLREVAGSVEVASALDVEADAGDGPPRARHAATGYGFTVAGARTSLSAAALGMDVAAAPPVELAIDGRRLEIAEHRVPLPLGALLAIALDRAIVPTIDAEADGLGDLLARAVGCAAVGEAIGGELGGGWVAPLVAACESAMAGAAELAIAELEEGEAAAVELRLTGDAAMIDGDGDGEVDALEDGAWRGRIGPATLPVGARFTAARR